MIYISSTHFFCLFKSWLSVHILHLWRKTRRKSDFKIQIFVFLHRYQQCRILMLSEYITLWAKSIHRKASWQGLPLFCIMLPRNKKLCKLSMFLPHAGTDCTASFRKPPNTCTLVLAWRSFSLSGLILHSALRTITITFRLSKNYCIANKNKICDTGVAVRCSTVTGPLLCLIHCQYNHCIVTEQGCNPFFTGKN